MVKWLAALFRLAFPDREDSRGPDSSHGHVIPNGNVHDIANTHPAVNKVVALKAKAARRHKVGTVTQDAE